MSVVTNRVSALAMPIDTPSVVGARRSDMRWYSA